jgi:hypothetical protein
MDIRCPGGDIVPMCFSIELADIWALKFDGG